VANFKFQIPKPKAQIALLVGAFLLLAAVAWGIGWAAHGLLDRQTTPPATTAEPAVGAPTSPALAATSVQPPAPHPTSTLRPTSTPVPTLVVTPTAEIEIVQHEEGLYQVCRRHCPERWPPDDADLKEYARGVARLNGLPWPNPALSPGQRLRMLPCP